MSLKNKFSKQNKQVLKPAIGGQRATCQFTGRTEKVEKSLGKTSIKKIEAQIL